MNSVNGDEVLFRLITLPIHSGALSHKTFADGIKKTCHDSTVLRCDFKTKPYGKPPEGEIIGHNTVSPGFKFVGGIVDIVACIEIEVKRCGNRKFKTKSGMQQQSAAVVIQKE